MVCVPYGFGRHVGVGTDTCGAWGVTWLEGVGSGHDILVPMARMESVQGRPVCSCFSTLVIWVEWPCGHMYCSSLVVLLCSRQGCLMCMHGAPCCSDCPRLEWCLAGATQWMHTAVAQHPVVPTESSPRCVCGGCACMLWYPVFPDGSNSRMDDQESFMVAFQVDYSSRTEAPPALSK